MENDDLDLLHQEEEEEEEMEEEEELKMVLVVRMDLKMGKGKIAAQCAHACLGAYMEAVQSIPQVVQRWYDSGAAKVTLKVDTAEDMLSMEECARAIELNHYLVVDAGRTQIAPGSFTVLALGPDFASKIDQITGALKLL